MVRAGLSGERYQKMEKRFMSVKELAAYLGVSVHTVYSWISTRRVPHYKVGRLPKFDRREIDECDLVRKIVPVE